MRELRILSSAARFAATAAVAINAGSAPSRGPATAAPRLATASIGSPISAMSPKQPCRKHTEGVIEFVDHLQHPLHTGTSLGRNPQPAVSGITHLLWCGRLRTLYATCSEFSS